MQVGCPEVITMLSLIACEITTIMWFDDTKGMTEVITTNMFLVIEVITDSMLLVIEVITYSIISVRLLITCYNW